VRAVDWIAYPRDRLIRSQASFAADYHYTKLNKALGIESPPGNEISGLKNRIG
jgi:hypothetical protein